MQSTGIIRKPDRVGRIVIPKELRDSFEIKEDSPVEFYVTSEGILLKKYETKCVFCGTTEELFEYKDRKICPDCAEGL